MATRRPIAAAWEPVTKEGVFSLKLEEILRRYFLKKESYNELIATFVQCRAVEDLTHAARLVLP